MLVNIERLQRRLDRDGLDGIVASSSTNVFYLTGIQTSSLAQSFAIVTRDAPDKPFLVTSAAAVDQTLDAFPGLQGVVSFGTFYREHPAGVDLTADEAYLLGLVEASEPAWSALDALAAGIKQVGLDGKKIAIDESGPAAGLLDVMAQRVASHVLPGAEIWRWVRLVKTAEELRRLRRSNAATERALIACQGVMQPGVTEIDVAREFERSIVGQGAVRRILHVRFGRNGVAGLARETDTRLEVGDTVWFDVGCSLEGYCSDLARTFSLGEPSSRAGRAYAAMRAGEEAAIAQARPGMTATELYEVTMAAVRSNGVPHYRRHHVGHSIGLDVYDGLLIAPGVNTPLESGMVINIETPYYEFGLGAVHAEDPFVVCEGGNEMLTSLSRDLVRVD